jgi:uncharacterized damage-inducible protein DinB
MTPLSTDLRFPTGTFQFDPDVSSQKRQAAIAAIREAPASLRSAVHGLDETQLNTPYRDGGWTVRQVVHHVPESHMNAFMRFKLALTEDNPTIKPYNENAWANLDDVVRVPIATSLTLLDALHERWVALLEVMTAADFARPLVHPDMGPLTLDFLLQLYAWHGRHHASHVTALRARRNW